MFHGKAEIKYLSAVFSDVPSAAVTAPGSPAPAGCRDLSHQQSIPEMSFLDGCLNMSVSTCALSPRHGLQMQNAVFERRMQPPLLEAQIPPLSRAAGCSQCDTGSCKYLILTLNTYTFELHLSSHSFKVQLLTPDRSYEEEPSCFEDTNSPLHLLSLIFII